MRIKKWDWVLFALPIIIAAAALLILYCANRQQTTTAVIQINGETVQRINLQTAQDGVLHIDTTCQNQIEIRDHQIGVTVADCPDQFCVYTGFIGHAGQSIVCVPARLVITITGEPAVDAVTGWRFTTGFPDTRW